MANDYERRLMRVIDHIHDHPDGDLSLDRLAEVAALSRFHFHRVFRAMTGETSAQAVRRMRLHRAAVLLVRGTLPPGVIGARVGYPDRASFQRAFAEHYGLSPSAFRRRGQAPDLALTFTPKGVPMYPVTLRDEPARRLAACPHLGPYDQIARAFEKASATMVARGLIGQARGMVGVYHDSPDDVAPEALRSHAGFVLDSGPILPPLEEVLLPGGRHAILLFRGPYSGLGQAYQYLFGQWLPQSGHEPADSPVFENYLNSPMDTAPEDLLTEIGLPLKV